MSDLNVYLQVQPNLTCKSNTVPELKRVIYGIFATAWNQRLNDFLLSLGYVKLKSDSCFESKRKSKEQIFPTGSLMYLSILTRSDISLSISYLSQYNNCFTAAHWRYVK